MLNNYLQADEIPADLQPGRGKLVGQKPPLKPKEVWSIRALLQLNEKVRDLALFNVVIDSKLRSCDLVALSTVAVAGGADGVWKTQADDDGGYLEVTIAPCDSDASKMCGKITSAFTKQGADPKYVNLGKTMVKDMTSSDGVNYSGGTIWDPEHNKTYKSKMKLKGDVLDIEGCVSIICTGQDWTRVK